MATRTSLSPGSQVTKEKFEPESHQEPQAKDWPDLGVCSLCQSVSPWMPARAQQSEHSCRSEEQQSPYLLSFSASTDTQRATRRGRTAARPRRRWARSPTWEGPGPALGIKGILLKRWAACPHTCHSPNLKRATWIPCLIKLSTKKDVLGVLGYKAVCLRHTALRICG